MIARKSALIIFIQIVNGILGYVGLKFIALYMQPWEYGIIGFAYGFVALFSILGNLGFHPAHVKKISEGKDLGTCIGSFISLKLFLSGTFASFTIISILIWRFIFNRGFESALHEQAIYILLLYFAIFTISQSFTTTFNAKKETAKGQIPLLFYTIVRIGVTIFVAYNRLGIIPLAYTYVIGEIFQFSIGLYFIRRYPIKKPSINLIKEYAKFAFPLAIASTSAIIMTNIDKVIIQLFWSAQEVGEYFAVFNLSRFIINFASAAAVLLLPTISEYHVKNNLKDIKKVTLMSERYLSMVVFPIIFLMVFLAEPIIHILLSDKYLPALPILQILPFFALLEVLSKPFQSQLQGMNKPHVIRDRMIVMVVINIILNIILIPRDIQSMGIKLAGLGPTGAAISTVVAYFVGFITTRIYAFRLVDIKGNYRIIYHAIAAIIMGSVLFIISQNYYIDRWFQLVFICLVGIGIYLTILVILREFNKKDFYFFLDTIHPWKMLQYIREEIIHLDKKK